MAGLQVVIGGSGGLGGAIARELAGRGERVRAVSRRGTSPLANHGSDSPGALETVAADVCDPITAKEVCAGAAVVYHAAQPPYTAWPERFPALTRAIADGAAAAGARLVMVDNLYMYGPAAGPLSEDTPVRATDAKGRVRAAMADALLAAHRDGRVAVTIGRCPDYYGPGGTNTAVADLVFGAAVRGRRLRWPGAVDVPHALVYLPDAAAGFAVLGERDEALGRVWHLPTAPALTGREFLGVVNRSLPSPLPTGRIGPAAYALGALASPMVREAWAVRHQFTRPFVVDHRRFDAAFGPLATTPHEVAVAATLDAFRRTAVTR